MSTEDSITLPEGEKVARRGLIPELKPEWIIPVVDTREQTPWELPALGTPIVDGLDLADYSFVGGLDYLRIERKSEADYLGSIFEDRFNREMQLIRAFPCHALIVESSWARLESGQWRSKATPQSVVGKTLGYIEQGVNVILADDRDRAQQIAARLIFISARRRWRELREMFCRMEGAKPVKEPTK